MFGSQPASHGSMICFLPSASADVDQDVEAEEEARGPGTSPRNAPFRPVCAPNGMPMQRDDQARPRHRQPVVKVHPDAGDRVSSDRCRCVFRKFRISSDERYSGSLISLMKSAGVSAEVGHFALRFELGRAHGIACPVVVLGRPAPRTTSGRPASGPARAWIRVSSEPSGRCWVT